MRSIPSLFGILALVVSASVALADEGGPRVPDGFVIEKAAVFPLVTHPMMAGFDDRGRLFVASAAGENLPADELLKAPPNSIQMLEDADGDGRFDKSTVFADQMTLPMGALWHRGALYVASPPSIWRLEDTDGDGRADRREELVSKFGFTGNAADIHGCFLGPEGRLYWADGRHGHEFTDDSGRVVSKGKAARIFSCRVDGSDVECFAGGGMDNPVEVDFTAEGELLGTANIMLSDPRDDTLVHWVEGGVYPRSDQEDCVAEFKRTGELLSPVAGLGHVAVSGLTRYRSHVFGPDYRGNLFMALFNTHSVIRSTLARSGSTFTSKQEPFLTSDEPDFHPTDVIEDADGSLLVIDTGGWFRIGCPTSQIAKPEIHGAIYRIRKADAPRADDPRGLSLRLERQSPEVLAAYLDDARPAVVERAIDLLALSGDKSLRALRPVLSVGSEESRRNAVWALSRIDSADAREVLRSALADENESIRIAAARAAGSVRDQGAVEGLIGLTVDDSPPVRREAATALGRICQANRTQVTPEDRARVVAALFKALETSAIDRVLEHAILFALIRIDAPDASLPHLTDVKPELRRAALIALDQMDSAVLTRDQVLPLLDTDDPVLQQAALAVIAKHEGWAAETVALLERWLSEDTFDPAREPVLRGFLLARCGDEAIQNLVAETLLRGDLPESVRLLLLEVVDRAALPALPDAWITPLGRSLESKPPAVPLQAVRILQARKIDRFDGVLEQLARDTRSSDELRVEALLALAPRMKSLDDESFRFLLSRLAEDAAPLERIAAGRALAESPLDDRQLVELAEHLDEAGPLCASVLVKSFSRSSSETVGAALVAAMAASSVSASFSQDDLAAVLAEYPPTIQQRAAELLNRPSADGEAQRVHLGELISATAGGSADRGRDVFFAKKAACSGCHAVRGQGGRVGPDLSTIGGIRTGRDLLEAVVFPSSSFAREFRTYAVLTDDGRVHTGVISRQAADSIVLRTAELAEVRIPRASIEELKESSASIMPKGLDQLLSRDELSDLLAFLQGLK